MRLLDLMLLIASIGWVGASLSSHHQRRIHDFVDTLRQCRDIPGVSLAVVEDGRTVLSRGYGWADVETGDPVTQDTRFCIASCTKAFTTALLGQLLHSHGHTWDSRLVDVFGEVFPFPGDHRQEHVTFRDLLLHRTGLPRYDKLWVSNLFTAKEIFRKLACMKEAQEFRTSTIYNNIMYGLAGHAAEVLEGDSWEHLVHQHFFQPLEMHSTLTLRDILTRLDNQSMADMHISSAYIYHPHKGRLKLPKDSFSGAVHISPAIAIYSTSQDMAKWLHFLLANGSAPSTHWNASVLQDMFTPQAVANEDPMMYVPLLQRPKTPVTHTYDRYGLAWFVGNYRGLPSEMHYGSFFGHYSMVELVRPSGLAIFSAINGGRQGRSYGISTLLHTFILDLAHYGDSWLTADAACQFEQLHYSFQLPFNRTTSRSLDISRYAGLYYSAPFGNLTISRRDEGNVLVYGNWQFYIYRENDTMFYMEPINTSWMLLYDSIYFVFHKSYPDIIIGVDIPFMESTAIPRFYKSRNDSSTAHGFWAADDSCSMGAALSATWTAFLGRGSLTITLIIVLYESSSL